MSQHEGHSPDMFKKKFWLTFALTVPVLLYSKTIQQLFHFSMPVLPGSEWLSAVLGTIIFFYGGLVFLKGAKNELADRLPGSPCGGCDGCARFCAFPRDRCCAYVALYYYCRGKCSVFASRKIVVVVSLTVKTLHKKRHIYV